MIVCLSWKYKKYFSRLFELLNYESQEQEEFKMLRNHSNSSKRSNSNYQSLYLWASFLLGIISLGIIVWNRRETSFVHIVSAGNRHPVHRDVEALHPWNLDPCIHAGMTQYSNFVSSLVLSALTYQQTQNTFASTLTLLWPPVAGLQFHKRQLGKESRVNTYTNGPQLVPRVARLRNKDEFIITWSSFGQDDSSWGVYTQRYASNATALGDEFRVNNYTIDNQSRSWVVARGEDGFVIIWNSFNQDGFSSGIYMKLYGNNGSALSGELPVNTYVIGEQSDPAMYSNDLNEFLILWNSFGEDGSSYGIYGRYYFNNGTVITDAFQINMYNNDDQGQPSAVAISNNRWVIAWHSNGQDGSSYGVYANIFTNHTIPLGPEFIVNQYTQDAQMAPAVIHFENEFIIFFLSQRPQPGGDVNNNNFGVYARHFADNGTALSDEVRISFSALSPWHRVSAAVLNQDYYIVVWKALSKTFFNLNVYGRICHREGNCTSSEFRINSFASDLSHASGGAVVALNNTSFVVVYDGSGPDDSDFGIYARIITLSELNITLPTPSPTPIPTLMPTPAHITVSEPATSSSVLKTTPSDTNSELPLSSSNSMPSSNSVPSSDNSNIGAYVGGAVAGVVVLGGLLAAGFFVCRKKAHTNKANSMVEQETGAQLQNTNRSPSTSQNYSRIDEVKRPERQYDEPLKLEI